MVVIMIVTDGGDCDDDGDDGDGCDDESDSWW